jgi:hypothetical protein
MFHYLFRIFIKKIWAPYHYWFKCGVFALKWIIFKQNHHYLDNLEAIFEEMSKSNLKSVFIQFVEEVAENPKYYDLVFSSYPFLAGPVYLPLDDMERVLGPEKDEPFYEPRILFELGVRHKMKEIKKGWMPPPLLVTFSTDHGRPRLDIADGTHKHEALTRCGYEGYYAMINYNPSNKTDLDAYLNSVKARATRPYLHGKPFIQYCANSRGNLGN